jgi:hypothetical protein
MSTNFSVPCLTIHLFDNIISSPAVLFEASPGITWMQVYDPAHHWWLSTF